MSRFVTVEEAQKLSKIFNELRINWSPNHEFSVGELKDVLKSGKFPCSINYISEYPKFGIIIRKSRGVYCFPKEPVHFSVIQKCFTAVRRESNTRYRESKPIKPAPLCLKEDSGLKEEECIKFLKDKGYLILKIC